MTDDKMREEFEKHAARFKYDLESWARAAKAKDWKALIVKPEKAE